MAMKCAGLENWGGVSTVRANQSSFLRTFLNARWFDAGFMPCCAGGKLCNIGSKPLQNKY